MYLKSLVLKGFKSFADRSVFTFEPGITAIVGPNGSGKSNISDAVLWVLGERNAKNLRGHVMEDVIFAGSSARKPVAMAEVQLVLDNTDGTLPIEFSEVSLTRRVYRSGESEYLINGSPARRMDFLDILHDSGMGTGTHSIISQGHLNNILAAKPEDHRALIEEAAGVLKHKQRKLKSERKLAQMDVHLTRVQDITSEVERQIKPLERKAKRALAYKDLSVELADLNLTLAVDDLRTLQGKWDAILERETKLDESIAAQHEAIEQANSVVETLQDELQAQAQNAGVAAQRYRRAQTAVDKLDSAVMLLHEKKRSMQSYTTEMSVSMDHQSRSMDDLSHALEQAQQEAASATAALEAALKNMTQTQEAEAHAVSARDEAQAEVTKWAQYRRDASGQLEQARADQAKTMELLSSNRAHEALIGVRAGELQEQLDEARIAAEKATKAAQQSSESLELIKKKDTDARSAVASSLQARDEARSAYEAAREEQMQLVADVRSLEQLERSRNQANPMLAWLLDNQEEFDGALKPLIQVIDVPDKWDGLVEQLLGSDIQALFVRDSASANAIARRLGSIDADGAVALVPQSGVHARTPVQCNLPLLIDELTFPNEVEQAVRALLGDVCICTSADEAQAAFEKYPGGCFATEDGLVIWPDGKMTVARRAKDDAGALASHRSLDQARIKLTAAQTRMEQAAALQETHEQELRDAQTASLKTSQELAALSGSDQAALQEAERASKAYESLQREFDQIQKQRTEAADVVSQAEPDAKKIEERIAQLTADIDSSKEKLEAANNAVAPARLAAEQAIAASNEAKLKHATCSQQAEYAQRLVVARRQDIETARQAALRAQENLNRKSLGLRRVDPLIEMFGALVEAARKRTVALEQEATQNQTSSSGLHARINEARATARAAQETFDATNRQLSDVRVEKGRMEMQVQTAVDAIVQDCHTPLEKAMELPQLEERGVVEDRAFKLRRRIANMGTINPDAAVEYEQLKVRFDYLTAQLTDMQTARRSLMKIIHVIDARMKDDFVNTFEQVNENFQQIFSELFPGGVGSLSLEDPDDPENTGVLVKAQPAGKRVRSLLMLSGGEKSLGAMALLLAVYKTRSTPFYILDEVEAPLDDTNLRRLVSYLDGMRNETQFIIITHQRRTMEMADVLFGVSMQADGVTKVVSQRLDKALSQAEGK